MERVIDRSELFQSEDEAPSSPDIENLRNPDEFEFVQRDAPTGDVVEDDEMDFCLFAPSADPQEPATVAKIRVKTPPLDAGDAGFLRSRDERYYFAQPPTEEQHREFEAAALSGGDVISRANSMWPGTAYPWRVLHIPSSKKQRMMISKSDSVTAKLLGDEVPEKRMRLGKQARLKVRTKLAAKKAREEQKRRDAELKEAAEQEKRTRRNREKKVKKKQREKAKKAVGAGDAAGADADEVDEGDSSKG